MNGMSNERAVTCTPCVQSDVKRVYVKPLAEIYRMEGKCLMDQASFRPEGQAWVEDPGEDLEFESGLGPAKRQGAWDEEEAVWEGF